MNAFYLVCNVIMSISAIISTVIGGSIFSFMLYRFIDYHGDISQDPVVIMSVINSLHY